MEIDISPRKNKNEHKPLKTNNMKTGKKIYKINIFNTLIEDNTGTTVCEVYSPGDAVNILKALRENCNTEHLKYLICAVTNIQTGARPQVFKGQSINFNH